MSTPGVRIDSRAGQAHTRRNPLRPVRAVLQDVKVENMDVRTYTLEVHEAYTAGAAPGQFNMLGYPGIGEAPISFSALPLEGRFGHTIRAVGMATRFIERMEKGEEVLVRGPYGRGWPMDQVTGKDLVVIAGGIGLAPLRPVINEVMKRRKDFGSVSVLFGARNEQSLIYADEYKAWQKAGISLQVTIDELLIQKPWKHQIGLITLLVDKLQLYPEKTIAFVCGPELMMRFVCKELSLKGVPSSAVHVSLERRMKCGVAQCGHCQHVGLFVCRDGPVFSYGTVKGLYDGML